MEVFDSDEKCEFCASAEAVRKMAVTLEDGRKEEKFLCASCMMMKKFNAYLSLPEQKNKIKRLAEEKV